MSTATQEVETAERPTNASVGKRLGITHAHVSRLRYGQRTPSLPLMRKIAEETGWTIEAQDLERRKELYAAGFRRAFGLSDDRETPE